MSPIDIRISSSKNGTSITITPEETTDRNGVDFCCVIDISGSMSTKAIAHNNSEGRATSPVNMKRYYNAGSGLIN